MKLLIVDDQNSVHLFLDKMLDYHTLGISETLHAHGGYEAITVIEKCRPELMLLDIQMPDLDGISLLEQVPQPLHPLTIVLSAYNEFEYARRCMSHGVVDYILKPIDHHELHRKLKQLTDKLRSQQISRVQEELTRQLSGSESDSTRLTEALAPLLSDGFAFACWENTDFLPPDTPGVTTLACVTEGGITACLFGAHAADDWDAFCAALTRSGEERAGMGMFRVDPAQACDALREALDALTYSYYCPAAYRYQPLFFQEVPNGFGSVQTEQLRQMFHSGSIPGVKAGAAQLFAAFAKEKIPPAYAHEFCYSFLLSLNPDFIEALRQIKDAPLSAGIALPDAEALERVFLRILFTIMRSARPEDTKTDHEIILDIRRYIEQNYSRDLSLDQISNHFFISKFQISRLFKKIHDINYQEFVLQVRMNAARQMLEHTNLKLYEVSQGVGFDEPSYFSNVFKKYFGQSPREFRLDPLRNELY